MIRIPWSRKKRVVSWISWAPLQGSVTKFCRIPSRYGVWWRRRWHPTPVLLPGKSHGWRSLAGCSPWGREESDTTERLHFHFSFACIGESCPPSSIKSVESRSSPCPFHQPPQVTNNLNCWQSLLGPVFSLVTFFHVQACSASLLLD